LRAQFSQAGAVGCAHGNHSGAGSDGAHERDGLGPRRVEVTLVEHNDGLDIGGQRNGEHAFDAPQIGVGQRLDE